MLHPDWGQRLIGDTPADRSVDSGEQLVQGRVVDCKDLAQQFRVHAICARLEGDVSTHRK